jgi:hypothetical protein
VICNPSSRGSKGSGAKEGRLIGVDVEREAGSYC